MKLAVHNVCGYVHALHEGIWGSAGIAPPISNLGIHGSDVILLSWFLVCQVNQLCLAV